MKRQSVVRSRSPSSHFAQPAWRDHFHIRRHGGGVVGLAGLTIDVGRIYSAKSGFEAATEAAALAGANAMLAANANTASVQAAVTAWNTAYPAVGCDQFDGHRDAELRHLPRQICRPAMPQTRTRSP